MKVLSGFLVVMLGSWTWGIGSPATAKSVKYEAVCECAGPPECDGGTHDSSVDKGLRFAKPDTATPAQLQSRAKSQCKKNFSCRPRAKDGERYECAWTSFSYRLLGEDPVKEPEEKADIYTMAKEVVDFAKAQQFADLNKPPNVGGTMEELMSPEGLGGLCAAFQDNIDTFIKSEGRTIAKEGPEVIKFHTKKGGDPMYPAPVGPLEAAFQTVHSHYFTVMTLSDGTAVLFDPSYPQFDSQAARECDATKEVHQRLMSTANGAAIYSSFVSDGFILLNDANAADYAFAITGKDVGFSKASFTGSAAE
jgi:hypothetical protein